MTYEEERKNLFLNYLNKHVFDYWRPNSTLSKNNEAGYRQSLELIISSVCNTKCTYCYYKNYRDELNPVAMCSKQTILSNLRKVGEWIKKEKFIITDENNSGTIEIFSGEFFKLPYYEEVLEILNDSLVQPTQIVIPTNGTFVFQDKDLKKVEATLEKYRKKDSKLHILLSLSIDGKYSDNITRPLRNGSQYTDDIYNRLFTFAAAHKCCFHPMICAQNIKYWVKNLDWFLKNISKYYNISEKASLNYLYLLEVRNPDWTEENLKDLNIFINFLIKRTRSLFKSDKDYIDNFIKLGKLNFLSSVTTSIGRGIGCSIQQCFTIRLADNKLVPCHRTSREGFCAADLIFKDGNLDIKLENPNVYMMINSYNFSTGPLCNHCDISSLCSGPCLGCNYEVNKDFFIPSENVCRMEHTKVYSILNALYENGLFGDIISSASTNTNNLKYNQMRRFLFKKIKGEIK